MADSTDTSFPSSSSYPVLRHRIRPNVNRLPIHENRRYSDIVPPLRLSSTPRISVQAGPNIDESTVVSLLINEIRRNPTLKVHIDIGNTQFTVSNMFALTMMLSGKAHNDIDKIIYEQRSARRTALELRGRGKLSKDEQDFVNATFAETPQ